MVIMDCCKALVPEQLRALEDLHRLPVCNVFLKRAVALLELRKPIWSVPRDLSERWTMPV